jgi:Tol biopolymer transport system component
MACGAVIVALAVPSWSPDGRKIAFVSNTKF